jgi:hypothetical protein
MHQPEKTLRNQLDQAAKKVHVGGLYYHYKQPGKNYRVLSLAISEVDDKLCVIYQAQYGESLIFVRPLENWFDKVEWSGRKLKRFTIAN